MALRPGLAVARRRLRRDPSVAVGDLVFTPVVLEESAAGAMADGPWLVAAKRPVAVIVAGPGGRQLVRLEGAKDPAPDISEGPARRTLKRRTWADRADGVL